MGSGASAEPGRQELECLRRIGERPSDRRVPCSEQMLRRLCKLGWIESYTALWLPLEMRYTAYRLTSEGRRILREYSQ